MQSDLPRNHQRNLARRQPGRPQKQPGQGGYRHGNVPPKASTYPTVCNTQPLVLAPGVVCFSRSKTLHHQDTKGHQGPQRRLTADTAHLAAKRLRKVAESGREPATQAQRALRAHQWGSSHGEGGSRQDAQSAAENANPQGAKARREPGIGISREKAQKAQEGRESGRALGRRHRALGIRHSGKASRHRRRGTRHLASGIWGRHQALGRASRHQGVEAFWPREGSKRRKKGGNREGWSIRTGRRHLALALGKSDHRPEARRCGDERTTEA